MEKDLLFNLEKEKEKRSWVLTERVKLCWLGMGGQHPTKQNTVKWEAKTNEKANRIQLIKSKLPLL